MKRLPQSQGYFPIFVQMAGRRALVIGGGRVAYRKCRDLLAVGAKVVAVSPVFCSPLERLSTVDRRERAFRVTDVRGSALVVAATDSREVNERAAAEANRLGIPVNVVDVPDLCTFIVPAVLRRGPVTVAVSTSGASPALARELRNRIDKAVPVRVGPHAAFLQRARAEVVRQVPDPARRRRILERLAAEDVAETIESEGVRPVRAMLKQLIRRADEPGG